MQAPGEELIGKLWVSLVDNGIGGLLRPWQIGREAKAELKARTKAIVAIAIAEKRAKDIANDVGSIGRLVAEREDDLTAEDERVEPIINDLDVYRRAQKVSLDEFFRKECNVARAILIAEEELLDFDGKVTEENIDKDWMYRWRDLAGDVSAEKLQYLWGQVLAGETKSPGQYSLRTLDFLKNLSQKEAQSIELIVPYIMGGTLIKELEGFPVEFGLTHGALLYLQDLGVLSSVESLTVRNTWNSLDEKSFVRPFVLGERVIIARKDDPEATLSLRTIIVTELGKQVASLVKANPNEKYLMAVGNKMKSLGFNVQLAKFVGWDDDGLNIDDEVDL